VLYTRNVPRFRSSHPTAESSPILHLEPGYRLDRYELLAPFAVGGMASIWLGRIRGKLGFERLVAVKTMRPEYADDLAVRKMLLDEARLAAQIRHTNVAEVLDVGEDNGVVYIVMEWVSGDSLLAIHRSLAQRGKRIPLPIVLRLAADTCRGLHAAHELRTKEGEPLGVVHRDVSPHNVLVGADGVAKLIDFGIAKARERLTGHTTLGLVKGKARYMPPEQVLGLAIDRRADVWAMGAVLQFLITGRTPYSGSNDLATLHKIATGEPPEPLPPEVPLPAASVMRRALAVDVSARFPTADALGSALEDALVALGQPTNVSHVMSFMREALSVLAERRQKTVDLASTAAEERERMRVRLQPIETDGSSDGSLDDPRVASVPGGPLLPPASAGDGRNALRAPLGAEQVSEPESSAPLVPSGAHRRPVVRRIALVALLTSTVVLGALAFRRPSGAGGEAPAAVSAATGGLAPTNGIAAATGLALEPKAPAGFASTSGTNEAPMVREASRPRTVRKVPSHPSSSAQPSPAPTPVSTRMIGF
jgi:serine/threonine protein kinase